MVSEILTVDDRKALHGEDYAGRFDEAQSPLRLSGLMPMVSLPEDAVVADIGCGNAMLLPHLQHRVSKYIGIDFSEAFIRRAEARKAALNAANAEFHCQDIIDYCRAHPETLDAAFAFDLSEHVYDDDWRRILEAVRVALKPGGRLFLHTPNLDFFVERMKDRNFILKQFPEHIAVRDMGNNRRLLEEAGFSISKSAYAPHYNMLKHLRVLTALPVAGKFFNARIFIEAAKPVDV